MLCWPTITRRRKKEPEGSIVSPLHRAALTDSSALSKADTVSHRSKIVSGQRGHGDWRTQDTYWYGRALECGSGCPSVTVPCCLDITHYCRETQEISALVPPNSLFPPLFQTCLVKSSLHVYASVHVRACVCVWMKWFGVKWLWVILND